MDKGETESRSFPLGKALPAALPSNIFLPPADPRHSKDTPRGHVPSCPALALFVSEGTGSQSFSVRPLHP